MRKGPGSDYDKWNIFVAILSRTFVVAPTDFRIIRLSNFVIIRRV
jgi:hypothetical protein